MDRTKRVPWEVTLWLAAAGSGWLGFAADNAWYFAGCAVLAAAGAAYRVWSKRKSSR